MESGSDFNFQHLSNYKFPCVEKTEVQEILSKWSMVDGLKLQAYSFDKAFKKYQEKEFLTEFLGSKNVISTLLRKTSSRAFSAIGVPAEIIKFSEVKCTSTTLEVFDKLKRESKVIRANGSIVKCMPQYIRADDGSDEGLELEVADNLRKMILSNDEDDDDFQDLHNILSEDDKKEFLVGLFCHLVTGGSLCQYEDSVEPYIEITKLIYKDLVTVATNQLNGEKNSPCNAGEGDNIIVISHVYKIHIASNQTISGKTASILFDRPSLNNFFYIVVNPLKQLCFTLYHHV